MKITGDWLTDMLIWHEATDPYEQKQEVQEPMDINPVRDDSKKNWLSAFKSKLGWS